MRTNKSARKALEAIYGKGCMFKKARIAEKIEAMGGIKTYKKFLEERRFRPKDIKKLERILTFHHLVHKFDGGRATVQNGAEVNSLAHTYMHSLPREQEEIINDMLRKYKHSIECNVEFVDNLTLPFTIVATTFTPGRSKRRNEEYNRAKEKRKLQAEIDRFIEGSDEYDR